MIGLLNPLYSPTGLAILVRGACVEHRGCMWGDKVSTYLLTGLVRWFDRVVLRSSSLGPTNISNVHHVKRQGLTVFWACCICWARASRSIVWNFTSWRNLQQSACLKLPWMMADRKTWQPRDFQLYVVRMQLLIGRAMISMILLFCGGVRPKISRMLPIPSQ